MLLKLWSPESRKKVCWPLAGGCGTEPSVPVMRVAPAPPLNPPEHVIEPALAVQPDGTSAPVALTTGIAFAGMFAVTCEATLLQMFGVLQTNRLGADPVRKKLSPVLHVEGRLGPVFQTRVAVAPEKSTFLD